MGRVANATPRPLYPQENAVPNVKEAGWASEPVWTGAENLAPTGIRFPDHPAHSESLYRLQHSEVYGKPFSTHIHSICNTVTQSVY